MSTVKAARSSSKKRPIKDSERNAWAALAQISVLDALMAVRVWGSSELAFHGGTSLHFSWHSPRFSEDLDFLLANSLAEDLPAIMARVERRAGEKLLQVDTKLRIEIRNKSSKLDRMGNFHVVVTHDEVLERVMVKAEFWSVDEAYLARYPTEFRSPVQPGDVVARTNALVPAGTLVSSIADKITALAGRPYLKWRDLFDVWWVTTQTRGVPAEPGRVVASAIIDQYLHNRTGYATDPGWTGVESDLSKLRAFCALDTAAVALQAHKDLKPFLPRSYWDRLGADGLVQIVEHTKAVATDVVVQVVERIEQAHADAETAEAEAAASASFGASFGPTARERQRG